MGIQEPPATPRIRSCWRSSSSLDDQVESKRDLFCSVSTTEPQSERESFELTFYSGNDEEEDCETCAPQIAQEEEDDEEGECHLEIADRSLMKTEELLKAASEALLNSTPSCRSISQFRAKYNRSCYTQCNIKNYEPLVLRS